MSDRGAASQGDETRLRLEVQRLRQELDALHEATAALADDERLDDLVSTIVERAAGLVEDAEGFLFLVDEDSVMRMRFATGAAEHLGAVTVEPGDGVVGRVWVEGTALAINDYQSWPARREETHGFEIQALAATPLHGQDGVIGVLGLWHGTVGQFSEDTLTLLDQFAGLAALALERTRLRTDLDEELEQRRRTEDEPSSTPLRASAARSTPSVFRTSRWLVASPPRPSSVMRRRAVTSSASGRSASASPESSVSTRRSASCCASRARSTTSARSGSPTTCC